MLELQSILTPYFGLRRVDRLEPLGNAGGMSGAALWRVAVGGTAYCLRCWPTEHPSPDRLVWIHQHMQRAYQAGCTFIPQLQLTGDGQTFVQHAGHLWEITSWMPGQADYRENPSQARLVDALWHLGQLHQALADPTADSPGCSPGIAQRRELAEQLTPQKLHAYARAIDGRWGPEIAALGRQVLVEVPRHLDCCRSELSRALHLSVPLQACLRDIWHDHVLFCGQRLTGIIDFGAMRRDTPAGDVARLLGSLAQDDVATWQTGLAAYERSRRLAADERTLLGAFDTANVVLAGLNWIRWLYVERRQFEDPARVRARLTEIGLRLASKPGSIWVSDETGEH